jgi:hypothetical protein
MSNTIPSLPIGAEATSEWEQLDGTLQRGFCARRGNLTIAGLQDISGQVTDVCLDIGGSYLDLAAMESLAAQLPDILAELRGWCPPTSTLAASE